MDLYPSIIWAFLYLNGLLGINGYSLLQMKFSLNLKIGKANLSPLRDVVRQFLEVHGSQQVVKI